MREQKAWPKICSKLEAELGFTLRTARFQNSDLYLKLFLNLPIKPKCDPGQWPAFCFLPADGKGVHCGPVGLHSARVNPQRCQNSGTLPIWLASSCCPKPPQSLSPPPSTPERSCLLPSSLPGLPTVQRVKDSSSAHRGFSLHLDL